MSLRELIVATGLSRQQFVNRMRGHNPRCPRSGHALYNWERRGTDKHYVHEAFAAVTGQPLAVVKAAFEQARERRLADT